VWSWETLVTVAADRTPVAEFAQSTFFAEATSPTQMRRRAADFRPERGVEGEIELLILQSMDGQKTLHEIASSLLARFPERFRRLPEALAFTAEMSHRLSR